MLMRLRGIKRVTVRKRGRVYRYHYHRATRTKIKADPADAAAFGAEVDALNKKAEASEPRDGSLGALVVAYRKAPEFTGLKQRTREDYDKVFQWLRPINDMPVIEIDAAFVYELRDKGFKQHKRRFANYVVQVVRLLLEWGKPRKFVKENEASKVQTIRRPKGMKKANRAWQDDERETVLVAAPIQLRAMIALGMFAGLREGDACAAGREVYDGSAIEAVASKNGEPLWIPAHFRLRSIFAEASAARREALLKKAKRRKVVPIDPPTLAVNSYGKSWTGNGFRASLFKLLRTLEHDGKVRPGLTFHGLRHTVGKLVIEAGGTPRDVAAILGDRSDAMGELYSREYDKRRRVASTMKKLERIERGKMEKCTDKRGKPS